MQYRIIVCDDNTGKLALLREKLLVDEGLFDIGYVEDLDGLHGLLAGEDIIDAIFLDLYFLDDQGNDSMITATQVRKVREAANCSKLIIYTAYNTEDTVQLMREIIGLGLVDKWLEQEDLLQREQKTEIEIHQLLGVRPLVDHGIWLLHVSDVHFGKTYEYAGRPIDGETLARVIFQTIMATHKGVARLPLPHLAIFSGDATYTASMKEFEEANVFMNAMSKSMRQNGCMVADPWIIVPGNHDLNWNLSLVESHKVVENEDGDRIVEERDQRSKELGHVKWMHFNRFADFHYKQTTSAHSQDKWVIYDYLDRLGINIIGYNSCQDMYYGNTDPQIDIDDLMEIDGSLNPDSNWNILVLHHPLELAQTEPSALKEVIEYIRIELGVRLILHGDQHRSNVKEHRVEGGRRVVEIGLPSTAVSTEQRPTDTLPGFQVLGLDKTNNSLNYNKLYQYSFSLNEQRYRLQTREGGVLFEDIELDGS